MATSKDYQRMETLVSYAREKGILAGVEKAQRDAEKIERSDKSAARGDILARQGYHALAAPFIARTRWLQANGS